MLLSWIKKPPELEPIEKQTNIKSQNEGKYLRYSINNSTLIFSDIYSYILMCISNLIEIFCFVLGVDAEKCTAVQIDRTDGSEPRQSTINTIGNDCFEYFRCNNFRFVRCKTCVQFPELVRLYCNRHRNPPIALMQGTRVRQNTMKNHLESPLHKECYKAMQQSKLTSSQLLQETAIGRVIQVSNHALSNHIGKLMTYVYGTAKKLTLTGNNFAARVVTGHFAENFDFNKQNEELNVNFQYITPTNFKEMLEIIVECHKPILLKEFASCLATSLRCDGSVDRTQIDKIFTMSKTVSESGEEKLHFLGVAEPQERGAKGLLRAVEDGCQLSLGSEAVTVCRNSSSIVTDGTSANTGEKGGLWTLFEEAFKKLTEQERENGVTLPPLLKIWCASHRAELAWKEVCKSVPEVQKILKEVSAISSFFHKSGIRTRELKTVALVNNWTLASFPKYFEVRWTEFTFNLINSILTSWRPLVTYFDDSREKEAKGFYKLLTEKSNLTLLAFISDVLQVFSRFQKTLQSNHITILDMMQQKEKFCTKIKKLQNEPLLGGWLCALNEGIETTSNGEQKLKNITLSSTDKRVKVCNRDINAIVAEIVLSLVHFVEHRFEQNQNAVDTLKKFIEFDESADLKKVHDFIAKDLSLVDLDLEFSEMIGLDVKTAFHNKTPHEILKSLLVMKNYPVLTTIFARIIAAKPNSADVERLISCNNILKSPARTSFSMSAESWYLYIYFNMPPLDKWDPRPAIVKWLDAKKRRHKDCPKAKKQDWYKGIFDAAETSSPEDGEENEDEVQQPKKKKRCF